MWNPNNIKYRCFLPSILGDVAMIKGDVLLGIIEFLPDATFVIDMDKKVIAWNRAIEELTGVRKKDIIGKGDYAYSVPLYGERRPILIDHLFLKDEDGSSEYTYVKKKGDIVYAETRMTELRDVKDVYLWGKASILYDSQGNQIGAIESIRDITEQKRVEEALKKSEEHFRLLAEKACDVIFRIRIWPEQNYEYISPAVEYVTGYTPQEYYDDPCLTGKIVHPDDRHIFAMAFENLDNTKPFELRWNHKDGRVVWTEQRFVPFYDDNTKLVAIEGVARDITERKQAEEELRSERQRLFDIIESLPDATFVIDKNKKVIAWNQGMEELTGVCKEDIIGKGDYAYSMSLYGEHRPVLIDFIDAEDKITAKRYQNFSRKGNVIYGEVYMPSYGGGKGTHFRGLASPLFDRDGCLAGAIESVHDITMRKQAEQKLYDAHQQLLDIIEFLPDATFVLDKDRKVFAWNKAIEEITGVLKEEVIGKGDYAYAVPFHGKKRPILIDYIFGDEGENETQYKSVEIKDTNIFAEVYIPSLHDGKGALFWVKASPLFDKEGHLIGAIETLRDITERKRTEEQLKYLSFHDPLTGLYNRAYFEEEMIRLEDGRHDPVSLIMCDIDGLKLVNDTLGHNAGDSLLVAVAGILKNTFREGDMSARIGGDEFAILLPHSDIKIVANIYDRIQKAIEKYNAADPYVPVCMSIGFATRNDSSTSMRELFKKADDSMYREKIHRVQYARDTIVQAMIKALDKRDFISEGHVNRLQDLVTDLAAGISLPKSRFADLRLLAQFHDIGKVGVPDALLYKPDTLTCEEYIEVQRHCEIGHRIAMMTPELIPITDWILKHHEWWNGMGYPLGLKGEDIPLECRILAIADAYDVMTSDRPYRKAMTVEKALEELKTYAGTQFDPNLVKVFLKIKGGRTDKNAAT